MNKISKNNNLNQILGEYSYNQKINNYNNKLVKSLKIVKRRKFRKRRITLNISGKIFCFLIIK